MSTPSLTPYCLFFVRRRVTVTRFVCAGADNRLVVFALFFLVFFVLPGTNGLLAGMVNALIDAAWLVTGGNWT